MSYGPKKLSSPDALDAIVQTIREKLARTDAFSSNSIAYYGIEFDFIVELKLRARGESELTLEGSGEVGDVQAPGETRTVTVSGKKTYTGDKRAKAASRSQSNRGAAAN